MQFHIVPRAVGKTTYLIDKVYREPDCQIIVAWESERQRLIDLLTHRCMEDGPPDWWDLPEHWLGDLKTLSPRQQREMYRLVWEHKGTVQTASQFKRGGPRRVFIDNVDAVLAALFGNVEEVTATANVSTKIPTERAARSKS